MKAAGTPFIRLYSGDTVFQTPRQLAKALAPLYRLLTAPSVRLVCCESSARSFEHFLHLRGDDVETERWAELRQSERLTIHADVPLPAVLEGLVVAKCRGAVALGLHLGAETDTLTLIDDILTVRKLRYHPEPGLMLLLTPEGKLKASYLGLSVKGRPSELQCDGVCGLRRPSGDFSYNARRASQGGRVWQQKREQKRAARDEQADSSEERGRVLCYGCAAAEDIVAQLVADQFRKAEIWAALARKLRKRYLFEERPWRQRRWILGKLLRTAAQLRRAGHRDAGALWPAAEATLQDELRESGTQSETVRRNSELAEEVAGWLDEVGVSPRVHPQVPAGGATELAEEGAPLFGLLGDDY